MTQVQLDGIIFSATQATKVLEQNAKLSPLTRDMAAAIYAYTIESPLYMHLNALLREENRSSLKPFFPYLRLLLTGLRRLPKEEGLIYRGVKLNLGSEYTVGQVRMFHLYIPLYTVGQVRMFHLYIPLIRWTRCACST